MESFDPTVFGIKSHEEQTPENAEINPEIKRFLLPYTLACTNDETWTPDLLEELKTTINMTDKEIAKGIKVSLDLYLELKYSRIKYERHDGSKQYSRYPNFPTLERIAQFAREKIGINELVDKKLKQHLREFFTKLSSANQKEKRGMWDDSMLSLLRAVLNMSRKEMAEKIRINYPYYKNHFEKHSHRRPEFETIKRICEYALEKLE